MADELIDPVNILAHQYEIDLNQLRDFNPSVITNYDIKRLDTFVKKYGIKAQITKNNFYDVKGRLLQTIQKKLEDLAWNGVLERERLEDVEKVPKSDNVEVDKEPHWD